MPQHPSTRRARSRQDSRANTPEARAIQEERRQRRLYPVESESARSMYAHWLNEFIADRLPAQPYPLGRQYARRFLDQVRNAHQATLAGY